MLRITRLTDYGIVLMCYFAQHEPGFARSARDLARDTHLPQPMVSKVLKVLLQGGLLESRRGAQGGYLLARLPAEISIAAIVRALEGPIAMTSCTTKGEACVRAASCPARPNWMRINNVLNDALDDLTLADLVQPAVQEDDLPAA